MPQKVKLTSSEAPPRRSGERQLDPGFLELVQPLMPPASNPAPPAPAPTRLRKNRSVVDGVEIVASPRQERPRSPADQNVTSFRGVPVPLKRSIDQFAYEVNFPVGIAARLLLELAIREWREGRLVLKPELCQRGFSLYPTSGRRRGRPVATRPGDPSEKKAAPTTHIAFRSIPDEVSAVITKIHQDLLVPKGEIARRFFEHSLALYKKGRLQIPDPVAWLHGQITLIEVNAEIAADNEH